MASTTTTTSAMIPWYKSLQDQNNGTWMSSVVEQSIELLTLFDGQCRTQQNTDNQSSTTRQASHTATTTPQQPQQTRPPQKPRDYAKLHDEFLEALLYEQQQLSSSCDGDAASIGSSTTLTRDLSRLSSCSTILMVPSNDSSLDSSKKRRLPRRQSTRSSLRKVENLDSLLLQKAESNRQYPDPTSFLDQDCLLQKDKGLGEEPGLAVCARGRHACLQKLQSKMKMLTLSSTKRGISDLKRLQARVTERASGYTETRSVFSFKVGFMTIQYGVLFRWLAGSKIGLVVLRKMCDDDFLAKASSANSTKRLTPPPPEWLVMGGNHALIQLQDGTEVALLDAPYRVERPSSFQPSRLFARLTHLEGLNLSSIWFLKLKLADDEYRVQLCLDEAKQQWYSKEPVEWEVPLLVDDACLELALLEQKRPSRARKKLRLESSVPLAFDSKKVSEQRHFGIDENGYKISITVFYQSDYAYGLFQELEARKRSVEMQFVDKAPLPTPRNDLEEEAEYFWDLCCVC